MADQKRVGIYVRCSTNGQDTALQKDDLRGYTDRRGWRVHRVYEDKAVSGARDSRPGLDALMREARQGRFDVVVVWRFDRFGRSVAHLVNALNEFQAMGIDFVSLNESVDTGTPTGRVLFSIMAAIAEFERTLIQERVKAGVARARAGGVRFGRPRAGFDYREAVEMRKAGKSYREIGRALGVSHSTVIRALRGIPGLEQ